MRLRRILVVALAMAAPVVAGCSGNDGNDPAPATTAQDGPSAGISEDDAIQAARAAWAEEEPNFDFEAHRDVVQERDDAFDVAFVPVEITGPGGEPHVVIARETGSVLDTYWTK